MLPSQTTNGGTESIPRLTKIVARSVRSLRDESLDVPSISAVLSNPTQHLAAARSGVGTSAVGVFAAASYCLRFQGREQAKEAGCASLPAEAQDNPLKLLQPAADKGDPLAAATFAINARAQLQNAAKGEIPKDELDRATADSRRYAEAAAAQGIREALLYLALGYGDGIFGQTDKGMALAYLHATNAISPDSAVGQAIARIEANVEPSERQRAKELAASMTPLCCK